MNCISHSWVVNMVWKNTVGYGVIDTFIVILRNVSGCGDICEDIVAQDVLTPLISLLKKAGI